MNVYFSCALLLVLVIAATPALAQMGSKDRACLDKCTSADELMCCNTVQDLGQGDEWVTGLCDRLYPDDDIYCVHEDISGV